MKIGGCGKGRGQAGGTISFKLSEGGKRGEEANTFLQICWAGDTCKRKKRECNISFRANWKKGKKTSSGTCDNVTKGGARRRTEGVLDYITWRGRGRGEKDRAPVSS